MDIQKIIAELRAEREQIEEAIFSLERLALVHGGRRRGRPPKWMTEAARAAEPAAAAAPKQRGRKKRAMPGRKRNVNAKAAEAAAGGE